MKVDARRQDFHVFSLQDWKNELRLIDSFYKGYQKNY